MSLAEVRHETTKTRKTNEVQGSCFVISWVILACVISMNAQNGPLLRVVEQGAQSHIEAARQVVARTAAEWAADRKSVV